MNDIMKKTWRGLLFALTLLAMVNVNAASFSYQGLYYTDSACTTGFSMNASGGITCSSSTTTPPATAAPVCSITQNPAFAQNGSGTTIYSGCSASPNNPTSYSWSLTPTGGLPSTVSGAQNYSPSTSLTPGTYTVSLAASNAMGPATGTLSTTLTVTGPAASSDLCTTYALPNTIEVPKAGNTSKYLYMPANGAYAFTFTAGAAGTIGSSNTQYSTVNQYMTISKNKCDFSPTLETKLCGQQGATGPYIRWKVGGTSTYQCILEPNTLYYVNIRDANQSGGQFTSTCPSGNCSFKVY